MMALNKSRNLRGFLPRLHTKHCWNMRIKWILYFINSAYGWGYRQAPSKPYKAFFLNTSRWVFATAMARIHLQSDAPAIDHVNDFNTWAYRLPHPVLLSLSQAASGHIHLTWCWLGNQLTGEQWSLIFKGYTVWLHWKHNLMFSMDDFMKWVLIHFYCYSKVFTAEFIEIDFW